jgi:hypothetical protein
VLADGEKIRANFAGLVFDKMQGGPAQFMAKSHCAVEELEEPLPKKEQGEASGIAGKT